MEGKMGVIHRGEIYYADLNPASGSEQGGTRPVLVLQNDIGNRHSPTVIVAAITSQKGKHEIPTHVDIGAVSGLHRDSMVLLEQIRTLDKHRLKGCVGALGFQEMKQVDKALKISFGLFSE
jgi:mRNA interferase MazF